MRQTFLIKQNAVLLVLVALITCSAFTGPVEFAGQLLHGTATEVLPWEKLGMRMVNYGLDRDEIPVTLAEGTFTSVKLIVNHSPINMHRFVVHFSNGSTQEVWVRKAIPRGGETRIIDLEGGKRGIKKVVFWYDTKKLARGRAVVELWGGH